MKIALCSTVPSHSQKIELDESEGQHLIKVLRLESGETVLACDGAGHYVETVLQIEKNHAWLVNEGHEVLYKEKKNEVIPLRLDLSITKGEAMEWTLEKAVELGVDSVQPIQTERTVVRMKNKGNSFFKERWQKIADQALKQCGRKNRLHVLEPIDFDIYCQKIQTSKTSENYFWCDESARSPHISEAWSNSIGADQSTSVLIGPEGGWAPAEKSLLESSSIHRKVSLGPLILRAETAATYCAAIFSGHYWKIVQAR